MIGLGIRIGNAVKAIANAITEGWDLYVSSNEGAPLNTANYLNVTLTTVITFPSLSGITITSKSGTAEIDISGNTIIVTTAGTLTGFSLSSGHDYYVSEGYGITLFSHDGTLNGMLSGTSTWELGSTVGQQTAIISRNSYDYLSSGIVNLGAGTDLTGKTVSGKFVLANKTPQVAYSNVISTARGFHLIVYNTNIGIEFGSASGLKRKFDSFANLGLKYGDIINWSVTVNDYDAHDFDVVINGVTITTSVGSILTSLAVGQAIGGRATGSYPLWSMAETTIDGVFYSSQNNYNGFIPATSTRKIHLPVTNGFDAFGNPEISKATDDGYNFTGQIGHHYDTGVTVDTTSHSSLGLWFSFTDKGREQTLITGNLYGLFVDVNGRLRFEYNGGTLLSTTILNTGDYVYCGLYNDGLGNGYIYLGGEDTPMALDNTGAVGVSASPVSTLKLGFELGKSTIGVVRQVNHHPMPYTLEMFENDRLATKKKNNVNSSFPYIFPFILS